MTANIKCDVSDGLMPSEKIVRIETADGKSEEVAVSAQNIQNNKLVAAGSAEARDEFWLNSHAKVPPGVGEYG